MQTGGLWILSRVCPLDSSLPIYVVFVPPVLAQDPTGMRGIKGSRIELMRLDGWLWGREVLTSVAVLQEKEF